MMAKALENNGATVYIIGRRLSVLQEAAKANSVSPAVWLSLPLVLSVTAIDLGGLIW
jgi:NADP-dependent 3-hydroxy acid dehydrogenase YdfG